jgi:hypothetical protein
MSPEQLEHLLQATAWYCDGPRIGPVTAVFVDDGDDRPVWALVGPDRLVPLCRSVVVADGRLLVVLPPGAVEAGPRLPPGATAIRVDLEDALYHHYAQVVAPVSATVAMTPRPPGDRSAVACRRRSARRGQQSTRRTSAAPLPGCG